MFSAPDKNIAQLKLFPNQVVADFGSGSGAHTLAAAIALRGTGKVYAVEVQQGLLTTLQNACQSDKISNVAYIWGDVEQPGGSKLGDATCDVVIVSNILFQAANKTGVIAEARRVLRPTGRLLLIDWSDSFNNMGPTKEHVFSETSANALLREMQLIPEMPIDAGRYHYGLIFKLETDNPNNTRLERN